MQKIFIILTIALGLSCTGKTGTANPKITADSVLICKSKSARAYHRFECRGLKHCSHTLVKISVAQAMKMGYRPCKFCYH